AHGIDFAHQVPLGNSSYRRIARHLRDQVDVERKQSGLQPQAGRGHGGLAAGVSGADHHHIVLFGKLQHGSVSILQAKRRVVAVLACAERRKRNDLGRLIASLETPVSGGAAMGTLVTFRLHPRVNYPVRAEDYPHKISHPTGTMRRCGVAYGAVISMANRGKLRRKMVLPVTVIRHDGEEKQLAHTLDVTETSARLGGLNMLLTPGECIEIQRGARKAKFYVYWMGARGTALEGQAGIRGIDPGKSIWSIHLPPDESDIAVDTFHLRGGSPSSRNSAAPPSEQRQPERDAYPSGATLRAPGSNYPIRVQLRNIYPGGLFVESITTLPLDTVVSLEMQIEGIKVEAAGRITGSVPRVGMEICFHKVAPETQRKILLALQKLKQKARDELQVAAPPLSSPQSMPGANGITPANCIDICRLLVAICKTLSADFDAWKSTRTIAEIEELRRAVAELQAKLASAPSAGMREYLASRASKPSRPV